jgi:hypothetical protein
MTAADREPPAKRRWLGFAVVAVAVVFVTLFLRSTSAWWFEDDPLQFAAAASIPQPAAPFIDPSVLRHWGTGASLVPLQVLSYWIDTHAFGVSPTAARIHDAVGTVACALLVFLALSRFGVPSVTSAVAACLWLCLPSTIAVHEFTSARHYVEGLAWSLAAVCVLDAICRHPPGKSTVGLTLLFFLLTGAAMLSKETYAVSLTVFAIPYALSHRRRPLAGAIAVLGIAYVVYRLALLGAGDAYPHPSMGPGDYVRYLLVLPYTLTAGTRGWVLVAILAVAAAWALRRHAGSAARSLLLFAAVFAAGLAATYPTAPAVLLTHETPGTWYRAVFLASTVTLIWIAYLLGSSASRPWQIAVLVAALGVILPGTIRTRAYWHARFDRSEEEGRFYLAHPDRLVYSEEDADWFLPGLDRLYGGSRNHFVSKNRRGGPAVRQMLEQFPAIWRYRDGHWETDTALYEALLTENAISPAAPRP